ncbi:Holliday junction resolvase RuvX [Thalassotalea euphylliae]|uniref:Holliday junction resolvase RuvX n=1 Tax=Thalassotalea euphylliae TaxID=1655234 RepID=UPI00364543DC
MAKVTKPLGQRTAISFDFGMKYIGIAVGQEITGSASALGSVKAKDGIPHWDNIGKFINEWQPDYLVIGLPLNMDGTEQPITKAVKKFGNRLFDKFHIAIEYKDERLTTASAKEQLFARGGYRNLKKDNIDAESAKLILESFFEQLYD